MHGLFGLIAIEACWLNNSRRWFYRRFRRKRSNRILRDPHPQVRSSANSTIWTVYLDFSVRNVVLIGCWPTITIANLNICICFQYRIGFLSFFGLIHLLGIYLWWRSIIDYQNRPTNSVTTRFVTITRTIFNIPIYKRPSPRSMSSLVIKICKTQLFLFDHI